MATFGNTLAWPSDPQQAQSVPAAPQQQGGGDPFIQELVKNISTPIDPSLVHAAITPIAGPHAAQVPSSLTTPIAPHQDRPMDTREVVGHKNARARGIGNAITGATNALGAVVNKEAQIKQGQIRDAATKVITAQQGIDEAKQALETAHAAGDTAGVQKATQLIQQNQQVRDAIFADPKMRKALVKGFDISYTDPQSNNTEEHKAVQEAMKQAKTFQEKKQIMQEQQQKQNQAAGTAAGAAYEKAAPQGMQPNQVAQAQLAIAQAQKKDLVDMYKTLGPAMVRADASERTETMKSMTELAKQKNEMNSRVFERNQTFNQRVQLMNAQQRFEITKLYQENGLVIQREQQRLSDLSSDPSTVLKASDESDRTWASAIANQQTQYDTAAANLDVLRTTKGATPEMISSAQAELEARKQMLDNAKDQSAYYSKFYDAKRTILGLGSTQKPPEEKPSGSGTSSNQPAGSIPNTLSGVASDGWDTGLSLNKGSVQ